MKITILPKTAKPHERIPGEDEALILNGIGRSVLVNVCNPATYDQIKRKLFALDQALQISPNNAIQPYWQIRIMRVSVHQVKACLEESKQSQRSA